jgi:hypothetical protein
MQNADAHPLRDAGMDLQREDTAQLAVGVLEIDARLAVDPCLNMLALEKVPIKYCTKDKSDLKVAVQPGKNSIDLKLSSANYGPI